MQSEINIDHGNHHDSDGVTVDLHPSAKATKQASKQEAHKSKEHVSSGQKHTTSLPPMQIVVQMNIYRDIYGRYEYLLLERLDKDKKFWQVVTEPVPGSDTLMDTLRQAVVEQVGISAFKHLSHELHSYEWYAGGERGRDIIFAAEVRADIPVVVDKNRYSSFAWFPYDEALQHLKWDGNKQALRQLNEHLRVKRLQMPATVTTGFYGNGSSRMVKPVTGESTKASQNIQAAHQTDLAHNPYGDNVSKRLPDVPEDGVEELKPYPDEDDERTGEWFL